MLLTTPMSGAMRGIFWVLLATLLAATMNIVARHVTASVDAFVVVFFRNLFGVIFLLPFLMRHGLLLFKTKRLGAHLARASLNVVNMLCFFTAVSITPLAELVALNFTAPIFAALLGMLILKEIVGRQRWTAIFIGFFGVMVIIRPGFLDFSHGHFLTLFAAFTWAGVMLMTKSLARTESSLTIVAYMTILLTSLSLIPALFVWHWPSWQDLGWLALMGTIGNSVHFIWAQAVREADLSVVMPFDFTKLVWIALLAYLLFGEVPAWTTWGGGALIFASGVFIARREALKRVRGS